MAQTADRIATIAGADSETTQALLAAMVTGWRATGAKISGVIGEPHGPSGRTCTAAAGYNLR
ncbi:MAG: DUF2478 domain-containing protein [Methylocapsa sp.]|nr:DUF2478 domain-containing protein [Methylocapsa sp.]